MMLHSDVWRQTPITVNISVLDLVGEGVDAQDRAGGWVRAVYLAGVGIPQHQSNRLGLMGAVEGGASGSEA